ncbi:hypothetical protein ACWGH3_37480 [Streptomyces sp. NPDC054884]
MRWARAATVVIGTLALLVGLPWLIWRGPFVLDGRYIDRGHPEREQCRAVFAQYASVVAMLPEGLINPDSQAKLRQTAGLL